MLDIERIKRIASDLAGIAVERSLTRDWDEYPMFGIDVCKDKYALMYQEQLQFLHAELCRQSHNSFGTRLQHLLAALWPSRFPYESEHRQHCIDRLDSILESGSYKFHPATAAEARIMSGERLLENSASIHLSSASLYSEKTKQEIDSLFASERPRTAAEARMQDTPLSAA